MVIYGDLVVLLNFAVDLCLLLGANRLSGYALGWKRVIPAALIGSLYAVACLIPGLAFLGNFIGRLCILALMSVVAFGANLSGMRRGILFVFLSMALGGIALGIGKSGFFGLISAAALVCVLCFVAVKEPLGGSRYVPVSLTYGGRRMSLTALLDTGNLLRDPVSGEQLLLVGADVAYGLCGLDEAALADPVTTLKLLSRGRLIPYRSVGKGSGLLLALPMDEVTINGHKSGKWVALAPNVLSSGKDYQALTGGVL